ncbi:hypothetical protein [Stutzerimonas xanthomarina]
MSVHDVFRQIHAMGKERNSFFEQVVVDLMIAVGELLADKQAA